MRVKQSGIYKWTCKASGGKVYIGQSVNLRKRKNDFGEFKFAYGGRLIERARAKYNDISYWDYEVLEYCTVEELDEREIYYIALYESNNPEKGYNITEGGGGMRGFKHSEEAKRKLSQMRMGKKLSPEHVEKLRIAGKGRKVSEETRRKLREINKGRVRTEETRRKISEAKRGKYCGENNHNYGKRRTEEQKRIMSENRKGKNVVPVLMYSKTGDFIREFKSMIEAAEVTGAASQTIGKCCNLSPHCKTAGGYIWRFKTDDYPLHIELYKTRDYGKHVLQMDLGGNVIAEWIGASEAAKVLGLKSSSIISACAKGQRNTAYGYKWRYA